jgi:hypothetical protein
VTDELEVMFDLPWSIKQCVDWWSRRHGYLQYPDRASGECGVETWNLMGFVYEKAGVSLEEIWGDYPKDCDKEPQYDNHTACCYGGVWVIDVTARQFWKDTPFPLIERIDVYATRFTRVCSDDHETPEFDLVQAFHERFPNLRQPDRVI